MKYVYYAVAAILLAIFVFVLVNKVSPVSWGLWGEHNRTLSGQALRGYDPVAFYVRGEAVPGNPDISLNWDGATWLFENEANRSAFSDRPMSFAPEFGGFCAFAVSKGFTANANPEAWHIYNDRLYVFMDKSVRDQWVSGIPEGTLERSYEHWAARTVDR